jgi:hypothetical protein
MADAHELPPPFAMMKMITGYWVSQVVSACAQLDVADAIAEGKTTVDAIAGRAKADRDAMARLLRTAASLGIVKRDAEGRFSTTPLGDTLRSGVPGSMRNMAVAETAPGHWLPWGRLAEAVRTGERQTPKVFGKEIFDYYADNAEEGAAFDLAMSGFSSLLAPGIAAAIEVPAGARIADIGGSQGELLTALVSAHAGTTGVLLDLPATIVRARDRIAKLGLTERVELVAGDFFTSVPSADLYVMKHILHDWNDAQCTQLLSHCAKAMRPGGRVLVIELVLPDADEPGLPPLMDMNMLVMLPGKERTRAEYARLFESAGLKLTRSIPTKTPFGVLEATKA